MKRNIVMTRTTCTMCDNPLGGKRVINLGFNPEDPYGKILLDIHWAINAAFCSNKCINKFEKVLTKIISGSNHAIN